MAITRLGFGGSSAAYPGFSAAIGTVDAYVETDAFLRAVVNDIYLKATL